MITMMGRGLNAVRLSTPSEELEAIANEARRELASAEARITALLERAREISTTAAKDQVELRRYIEECGFELATLERQEANSDHGTGPLFDVNAMRQSARDLNSDVSRSNALESNLSIVLYMLQDAGSQLTPDRVFGRILDTADLRLQQAMNSAREDERRRLAREIHDGPS